jgi:hypothetical protein
MEPIITVNEYPIGWEWLDNVPLEDFNWLIEIFSTMTDDICTYDLDIRDILKSYIIARYYGWEPKEEDLEEIISHTSFFDINIDDAIYEVLTMPREKITKTMKTTNPSSRITISQNGNQILTCKVYKEPNYILSMSNEEILEFISGLDYMGNIPTVPDLEKPIEIQVSTIRQIPLEQNKEVQTKIKEIIYNNLYDTLIDELKGTISRFQAQYNIQEINPYLQDILQNPEDLVSLSQHHKR